MTVLSPADAVEARAAVEAAINIKGPVYIRFGRYAVPVIFEQDTYKMEVGRGIILAEGRDAAIFATGFMTHAALEARALLKNDGIDAAVINIHTVKPIDRELVIAMANTTGAIVTCEEHNIIGGLGDAVSEVVCECCPVPVFRVGVRDQFGRSGKVPPLLEHYGLTPAVVAEKVKAAVALKK